MFLPWQWQALQVGVLGQVQEGEGSKVDEHFGREGGQFVGVEMPGAARGVGQHERIQARIRSTKGARVYLYDDCSTNNIRSPSDIYHSPARAGDSPASNVLESIDNRIELIT